MTFLLDLDNVFTAHINANQKKWKHDRSKTVGASEVFRCNRWNVFNKRGEEFGAKPNPDFAQRWGAMQRGNLIEDHHVAPALKYLPEPLRALYVGQKNQKTLISGKNSATPDGLIVDIPEGELLIKAGDKVETAIIGPERCMGIEIKSIDPRATLGEAKDMHRGQSQVGLGLIREKTKYKPRYWLILYVDASFIDNVTPFLIEYDESIYATAKTRAEAVYAVSDPLEMPAEGKWDNQCDNCPFSQACGEAIFSRFKDTRDAMSDEASVLQCSPLVQEYADCKAAVEQATEDFNKAKEALKARLLEIGTRKVVGPNWRATWTMQQGRESVDVKAAEAAGIDLDPYKKRGAEFEVLRVTVS